MKPVHILITVLFLALVLYTNLPAQSKTLTVITTSEQTFESCKISSIENDTVELEMSYGSFKIPVDSLYTLITPGVSHMLTGAGYGAAIGGISGTIIGAVTANNMKNSAHDPGFYIPCGLLVGAASGFIIGGIIGSLLRDEIRYDLYRDSQEEKVRVLKSLTTKWDSAYPSSLSTITNKLERSDSADKIEEQKYTRKGLYLGVMIPHSNISGDFNGNSLLVSTKDINLVPKIESTFGWGITIGGRFLLDKKYTLFSTELVYQNSSHSINAHFTNVGGDLFYINGGKAKYSMVAFDCKGYPYRFNNIEPFFLVGLVYPHLTIKDGSVIPVTQKNLSGVEEIINYKIGDVSYTGLGVSLGGGVSYFLNQRIYLNGDAIFRIIKYNSLTGASGIGIDTPTELSGRGWYFSLGVRIIIIEL